MVNYFHFILTYQDEVYFAFTNFTPCFEAHWCFSHKSKVFNSLQQNIMPNNYRMSYFMPPIAPVRNGEGRIVTPATLLPFCEVSVEQVFQIITCNENLKALTEQVRNAPDMRTAKATLLPYVTPCGTFTRRNSKCFLSPSRLVVIDVDHLDSYEEAAGMRRTLFDDPFLCPVLTYISPSGRGVKAFVPTGTPFPADEVQNVTESINKAMQYVEMTYTPATDIAARTTAKGVDGSGKDLVRACFLSHDPEALFRNI